MIQLFVVLFNLEIGNKISCNHRADAVNGADFIRICMADGFQEMCIRDSSIEINANVWSNPPDVDPDEMR